MKDKKWGLSDEHDPPPINSYDGIPIGGPVLAGSDHPPPQNIENNTEYRSRTR